MLLTQNIGVLWLVEVVAPSTFKILDDFGTMEYKIS